MKNANLEFEILGFSQRIVVPATPCQPCEVCLLLLHQGYSLLFPAIPWYLGFGHSGLVNL